MGGSGCLRGRADLTARRIGTASIRLTQTGHVSTPRLAESSTVSAARHAHALRGVPVANERSSEPSPVLPLLFLVMGLDAASVWFVALPALDEPPRARRSCEVYVLKSGATKCVAKPRPGSHAASQKNKLSTARPKH